jgi:hypothetical protein
MDGHVRRGAQRAEDEGHAFVFDQAARLFHGLRRRVGVVEADQLDFAAIDATLLVDHR